MRRIKIWINSVLFISVFLLICNFPVSADDKITFVRPIPDEFSQNDNFDIYLRTTYPSGSFISFNFTLDTPYPHRGKLSGKGGTGGGTCISDNRTFIFHKKESLHGFIPGDWNLTIWEDSNFDKAYSKIIHIYPAELNPDNKSTPTPPDKCYATENYPLNFKLNPDPAKTEGVFAKGQPLYLTGKGLSDSDIGIWIYKEKEQGGEDYSRFEKIKTDCNGDISGDGEILSVFNSYTIPPGRYFIYAVSGDTSLIRDSKIPESYADLEKSLSGSGLWYQKFTILAEEPVIYFNKNIPKDAVRGTQLTIDGGTNLKSETVLEIFVNPSAVDGPDYQGMIMQSVKVENNGISNIWTSTINTSVLGAGEYIISVESPKGLGEAENILNVYDQKYEIVDPAGDLLSTLTYIVDDDTKNIKEQVEIQQIPDSSRKSGEFLKTLFPLEILQITEERMLNSGLSATKKEMINGILILSKGRR
ncbi:hypothetical protein F1737_05940 [Methanoplanus sp. FWC-SCC4]|uniref:Uncharacterized protein n=1 Tax=Methanochimaera problematica TaxID=2609417 RepID=A0AA97FBC0_9EURY|nr:hypothetical protein [Methanoplanus sp. FWC-SCC4]WOF16285.1 hypothetical protein F1737_05940 [Methanoplanus sp. FWC-SCC4]